MNAVYRIVWNAATGQWTVASELAKGRKKSGVVRRGGSAASKRALLCSAALVAGVVSAGSAFAQALPVSSRIAVTNGTTLDVPLGADIDTTAADAAGRGVWAQNVGSMIVVGSPGGTGTILDVTTTGGGTAYAVQAAVGGAIVVNGDVNASTIGDASVTGPAAIFAANVGSRIDIHGNATALATGLGSFGMRVQDGGALTVDGIAKATTMGNNSSGIRANSNGKSGTEITVGSAIVETFGVSSAGIVAQGVSDVGSTFRVLGDAAVTTRGLSSVAVFSYGRSNMEVGGSALVVTEGDDSFGLYVRDAGSVLTVVGDANVVTNGAASVGVRAINGVMNLANLDVATSGLGSTGIYATGLGASVTASGDATVSTSGDDSAGILASSEGNINLAGAIDIATSGAGSSGVVIDGAGSDVKLNDPNGSITTTGDNSHAIEVTNGAAKTLDGTTDNVFPNDISVSGDGSAVVAATNTGSLTLGGSVALDPGMVGGSGSWGILADAGTVVFQDSASTGGTAANVTNTGSLSLSGNASGAGSHVELTNGGTLAINDHNGAASIGSLGGDSSGQVVLGDNVLTVGVNNATGNGSLIDGSNYAGSISGNGGLTKEGDGTQILSGELTYTGDTVINDGKLVIEGTLLPSDVFVNANGALGGNGTIGNLTNSGTLEGNLNITGNLTVKEGARIVVAVDPTNILSGQVNVQGAAVLEGGYVDVRAADVTTYNPFTHYTILTAGNGVSGQFDGATSDLAFLSPSLSYDPNSVQLTLRRNDVAFSDLAGSSNQASVANALESMSLTNPVYGAVVTMGNEPAAIRNAFDQLSGEVHASAMTVLVNDSRFAREAVNSQLRETSRGARTQGQANNGCVPNRDDLGTCTTAWVQAFGSSGDVAAGLDRSISGFFMGADKEIANDWRLGVFGGYTDSDFDVDNPRSSGTASTYHLGLYGGKQWENLGFRTGVAYSRSDVDTKRSVAINGFSDNLRGSYHADTIQVFGELGYKIELSKATLEPFVNLAYVSVDTDSWKERGGSAALKSSGDDQSNGISTLGLRASTEVGSNIGLWGSVGWQHVIGDVTPESRMAFNSGSNTFSISGAAMDRDVALIEAGATYQLTSKASIGLGYRGALGSDTSDHGGQINLRVMF